MCMSLVLDELDNNMANHKKNNNSNNTNREYIDVVGTTSKETDIDEKLIGINDEDRTTLGPEPEILNSRTVYKDRYPHTFNEGTRTSDKEDTNNISNTDEKLEINPSYTKFSVTLLLWAIAVVVFIISYLAIRYNGLYCPILMNDATIIRKGIMLSDMDTDYCPCTQMYEYACGGYLNQYLQGSTLSQMQEKNFVKLTKADIPQFNTFIPDSIDDIDIQNFSFDDFTWYGIYSGFNVEVLPSIFNPVKYALYISAKNPTRSLNLGTSQSITEPPPCIEASVLTLTSLIDLHLTRGHEVLILDTHSVCEVASIYSGNTSELLKNATIELEGIIGKTKWEQFMNFYQNTVSETYANGRKNTILNTFAEKIRNYVLKYVNEKLPWPDSTTRKLAYEKIKEINIRIGTGTKSISDCTQYSTTACIQEQWAKTLVLVGDNVNPSKEWDMSSAEANAYYSVLHNHIVIPYGIAESPLYSDAYPDAWNVAGLGVIIAHELGHSIDTSSIDFSNTGAYKPWLTQTAAQAFKEYIACIDGYYISAGMSEERADNTINENIADFIGVESIAYGISLLSTDSEELYKDVFILFAQTWCRIGGGVIHPGNYTDPHAAAKLRVNVTLSHNKEFNAAFQCNNRNIEDC